MGRLYHGQFGDGLYRLEGVSKEVRSVSYGLIGGLQSKMFREGATLAPRPYLTAYFQREHVFAILAVAGLGVLEECTIKDPTGGS